MSDRHSTWLRVPDPARFVCKQNKAEAKSQNRFPNMFSKGTKIKCDSSISAVVEIDADVWTFADNRNSTGPAQGLSTYSRYYLAHRQHVAGELSKGDMVQATKTDLSDALWDGFLRELSV
jgi:hypothetical protein